ncbi:glycoside hydrolase family 15 protein [Roseomonas elaeocarpi]|uniref:Glycoside hydrolase family 15 protein n=1 Tax=Roseomonas elaeocarpi TaxID=907779 RepID=A0ABV6JQ46_9PROT
MDRDIDDYALIGDMRSAALIGRDAAIDWLCWPRFDSPALFLRLLDSHRGGSCTLEAEGLRPRERRYLPRTNILETTLSLPAGELTVTDLMPVRGRGDAGPEDIGPDSEAAGVLMRHFRCDRGRADFTLRVAPSFDWGRAETSFHLHGTHGAAAHHGDQALSVLASAPLVVEGGACLARFSLRAGEEAWIVLAPTPTLPSLPEGGAMAWLAETRAYWEEWTGALRCGGEFHEMVERSALCLKLLCYAPSGGIVAAPTLGLPEGWRGGRNWDYRYTWVRDASFTVSAFLSLGHSHEAAELLRFLDTVDGNSDGLRVLYGIERDVPPEQSLDHLRGWRGIRPVLIGNEAEEQLQLDIYGNVLIALDLFVQKLGAEGLGERMRAHLPRLITRLADKVMRCWHVPDRGIWEMRKPDLHHFHSKAMCWVTLDRAVKLAEQVGPAERIPDWCRVRDEIRAEYEERGWDAKRGAYTQAYGEPALDGSFPRLLLFGAVDPLSERSARTLAAIDRELGVGPLIYRYRTDDGLPGQEATFAACAFWMVGALAARGELDNARQRFRALMHYSNDLGLFSEEITADGIAMGNFPQAFTHMTVITIALLLERAAQEMERHNPPPFGRRPVEEAVQGQPTGEGTTDTPRQAGCEAQPANGES